MSTAGGRWNKVWVTVFWIKIACFGNCSVGLYIHSPAVLSIATKLSNISCDIKAINRISVNLEPEHLKQKKKKAQICRSAECSWKLAGSPNSCSSWVYAQVHWTHSEQESQGMGKGALTQIINDINRNSQCWSVCSVRAQCRALRIQLFISSPQPIREGLWSSQKPVAVKTHRWYSKPGLFPEPMSLFTWRCCHSISSLTPLVFAVVYFCPNFSFIHALYIK